MALYSVLRVLILALNTFTMAVLLYQLWVALFCLKPRPKRKMISEKQHRFGIVISARNEETVIGHLVSSLMHQDYPKECFDVFVVADNCTDATAKSAAAEGAIVLERFDEEHKGKGYALNWVFSRILKEGKDAYDAFCIFDADNLVHPGYLAEMNRQLCCGADMAQGYRDIKNPGDTWISGSYAIYFWCLSKFYMIPRENIGLSCLASGTGFMFRSSLIWPDGWNTYTITEDSEFTVQQIIKGKKVVFAENAVFYDEQPTRFRQSIRQRYRWGVGNVQSLTMYLPKVIRAWKKVGGRAALDIAVFLVAMPGTGLVVVSQILMIVLWLIGGATLQEFLFMTVVPMLCSLVVMFIQGIVTVKMSNKKLSIVKKGIFGWPIFLYVWMYIILVALFYRDTTWKPIPHTRDLGIESLTEGKGEKR